MASETKSKKENSTPIRLSENLSKKVADASDKTGLSKQDVMRLAIERGVDVLLAQLTTPVAPSV